MEIFKKKLGKVEIETLLGELTERIPYHPYVMVRTHFIDMKQKKTVINHHKALLSGVSMLKRNPADAVVLTLDGPRPTFDVYSSEIRYVRPFLRPLSSMTEEEKRDLELLGFRYESGYIINENVNEYDDYNNHPYTLVDETKCSEVIKFLNSHHLDYNGLIEKGLAIVAPLDMYKI